MAAWDLTAFGGCCPGPAVDGQRAARLRCGAAFGDRCVSVALFSSSGAYGSASDDKASIPVGPNPSMSVY